MDAQSRQWKVRVPDINREIVVYQYGDSPKKVLLVHGWSGRGTQMAVMAKQLLENGYSVLSFDAPGHGKAPGKRSMMPFFYKAIEFLDDRYGPFTASIGHSLGGMALLKAANKASFEKIIVVGTANSISHITNEFARNMHMNDKVATKIKAYFDRRYRTDLDALSGAVSAAQVPIPTLVIHDVHDVDVSVTCAYEIHSSLPYGELLITEGLGHRKILGDAQVIKKILESLSV